MQNSQIDDVKYDLSTLIYDVLDILAELVREEPDDGENDETSEDTRTDIAHRHDHRVSTANKTLLLNKIFCRTFHVVLL